MPQADSQYRQILSYGIQIGYLYNYLVFSYGENSKIRKCFLFTLLFLPLLFCGIYLSNSESLIAGYIIDLSLYGVPHKKNEALRIAGIEKVIPLTSLFACLKAPALLFPTALILPIRQIASKELPIHKQWVALSE